MKVVVLGARGQIGSLICDHLKQDFDVIGTSRKVSEGYLRFDPSGDDWTVLGKVDVLINCVGQIDGPAGDFHRAHVGTTELILQNRETLGGPMIIQISALGASTDHPVDFLRTKGIADALLLRHPRTVVVRPSIVCTPNTMLVKKMVMLARLGEYLGGVVFAPAGFPNTRVQPVMPGDLAGVVRRLCAVPYEGIVPVVGPDELTFSDIARMMTRNHRLRFIEVPRGIADFLIGRLVTALVSKVLSRQQYQLLFYDNVADRKIAEDILDRRVKSTRFFFEKEFGYATH